MFKLFDDADLDRHIRRLSAQSSKPAPKRQSPSRKSSIHRSKAPRGTELKADLRVEFVLVPAKLPNRQPEARVTRRPRSLACPAGRAPGVDYSHPAAGANLLGIAKTFLDAGGDILAVAATDEYLPLRELTNLSNDFADWVFSPRSEKQAR
jgi:hypothetical protein